MTAIVPEWEWSYDGWIILVMSMVAMICAIPGAFLLIRRQAMLGDAISHAVLPGIAVGFLVSGARSGLWILVGATIAGVATAVLAQALRSAAGVDRGAALGVVFSTLFALGLVLIVQVAESIDLDPACVLYGQVELIPLELVDVGGLRVPSILPSLIAVLGIVLFVTSMLWKELIAVSFDAAAAESLGIPAVIVNQVLMILVAVACVVAFEAVGSILVVSLLVTPAAAARLLTRRLSHLLILSVMGGIGISVLGHLMAIRGFGVLTGSQISISTTGTTASIGMGLVGVAAALPFLRSIKGPGRR